MSGDVISDKTTVIQCEPLTPVMRWNVVKCVSSVGKYSDVNGLSLRQDLFFSKCALCFLSQRVELPFVFQREFGLRKQSLGKKALNSHYHLVSSEDVFCNTNCENAKYLRSRHFFSLHLRGAFVVGR